jgi:hypothetical protein
MASLNLNVANVSVANQSWGSIPSGTSLNGDQTFWIFAVVILITIALGHVLMVSDSLKSPWWSERAEVSSGTWDWLNVFNPELWTASWRPGDIFASSAIAQPFNLWESPSLKPPPNDSKTVNKNTDKDSFRQTWCFVGEDMTGRYCVKVPSPGSCDADRRYYTRLECEMNLANAMPAGVITNHGVRYDLLSSGRLMP